MQRRASPRRVFLTSLLPLCHTDKQLLYGNKIMTIVFITSHYKKFHKLKLTHLSSIAPDRKKCREIDLLWQFSQRTLTELLFILFYYNFYIRFERLSRFCVDILKIPQITFVQKVNPRRFRKQPQGPIAEISVNKEQPSWKLPICCSTAFRSFHPCLRYGIHVPWVLRNAVNKG